MADISHGNAARYFGFDGLPAPQCPCAARDDVSVLCSTIQAPVVVIGVDRIHARHD